MNGENEQALLFQLGSEPGLVVGDMGGLHDLPARRRHPALELHESPFGSL
jgi:hypothetical protein